MYSDTENYPQLVKDTHIHINCDTVSRIIKWSLRTILVDQVKK